MGDKRVITQYTNSGALIKYINYTAMLLLVAMALSACAKTGQLKDDSIDLMESELKKSNSFIDFDVTYVNLDIIHLDYKLRVRSDIEDEELVYLVNDVIVEGMYSEEHTKYLNKTKAENDDNSYDQYPKTITIELFNDTDDIESYRFVEEISDDKITYVNEELGMGFERFLEKPRFEVVAFVEDDTSLAGSEKTLFTEKDIKSVDWAKMVFYFEEDFLENYGQPIDDPFGGFQLFDVVSKSQFRVLVDGQEIFSGYFAQSAYSSFMPQGYLMSDFNGGVRIGESLIDDVDKKYYDPRILEVFGVEDDPNIGNTLVLEPSKGGSGTIDEASINASEKVENMLFDYIGMVERLQEQYDGCFIEKGTDHIMLTSVDEEGVDNERIGEQILSKVAYLTHDTSEWVTINVDTILDSFELGDNMELLGAYETGPMTFNIFYKIKEKGDFHTYVSGYTVDQVTPLETKTAKYKCQWQIPIDGQLNAVFKDANTLFLDYSFAGNRYLSAYTHDLNQIMCFSIEGEYKGGPISIHDVNLLEVNRQLEVHVIVEHNKEAAILVFPYENKGKTEHILACGDYIYKNGLIKGDNTHVENREISFVNLNGDTYLESNNYMVFRKFDDENHKYWNVTMEGLITYDANSQVISAKDYSGKTIDITDKYQSTPLGDNIEALEDGSGYVYVEKCSNEMIVTDNDHKEVLRKTLPSKVVISLLNNEQYISDYMEPIKGGIAFRYREYLDLGSKDVLVVYSFDKDEFIVHDNESCNNLDLNNHMVTHYLGYKFYYDLDDQAFHIIYDDTFHYRNGLTYDGIYYYEDDDFIAEVIDENILNSPDYKPLTQAPSFITEYGEEEIMDGLYVESVNGVEKYQSFKGAQDAQTGNEVSKGYDLQLIRVMDSGMLGYVSSNDFTPLTDMWVRTYDSNQEGVVYSGYMDKANGYYYSFETDKTYELNLKEAVNEIRLVGESVFILTEGAILQKYSAKDIRETGSWKVIDEFNALDYAGWTGMGHFKLDTNDKFLVLYVDEPNYGRSDREILPLYILDETLNVVHTTNGWYTMITEENYVFYHVYAYLVRCDIARGYEEVIEKSFALGVEGYHNGKLIVNDAYEGPGMTWLIDVNKEEMDLAEVTKDYNFIAVGLHQTNFVLINSKDKKVTYLDLLFRYEDGWIEENEVHIIDNGVEKIYEVPGEGTAKVENLGKY